MSKQIPAMRTEVAIRRIDLSMQWIEFWATPDAAQELRQFGQYLDEGNNTLCYTLKVDGRFDFDEVVEYIRNYDND